MKFDFDLSQFGFWQWGGVIWLSIGLPMTLLAGVNAEGEARWLAWLVAAIGVFHSISLVDYPRRGEADDD